MEKSKINTMRNIVYISGVTPVGRKEMAPLHSKPYGYYGNIDYSRLLPGRINLYT